MGVTQPEPGFGYAHAYTIRPNGSRGPSNLHPLVLIEHDEMSAWVDEDIADDVRTLWRNGISTLGSCQGDKDYSRFIDLAFHADLERAASLLSWVIEAEPHPPTLRGFYDETCCRDVPNPPSAIWSAP